MDHGVGAVDAVDLGRLEHHFDAHLGAAQGSSRVGGKEWVTGAGSKDHHLALFKVTQGLGPDVGLDHLLDLQCRLNPSRHARLPQRILQGQGVHHGGQHPHVVGGGPVHAG